MSEKIEMDSVGHDESETAWYAAEKQEQCARLEAEDDLRIRMFALDMAVTALPSLASSIDSEDTKFRTLHRAAAEFEKILRGEPEA